MHYFLPLVFVFFAGKLHSSKCQQTIGQGRHPAVNVGQAGDVHVVYGRENLIYYVTSADGLHYVAPVRIDSLPGLHLGASRGPQIAATANSVVITAIDKQGDIWAYRLDRSTGRWQKKTAVTDVPGVAKEGFVSVTAGPGDTYTAVWLDLRGNQRNKIVGAQSTDGGKTWLPNRVLYQSPAGTVCECCQLSVVHQGKHIAVLFRNLLNGSRDMYLLRSSDAGQTFGAAKKVGEGTWKLNACPMDGGGLFMAPDGRITTVWRRNDTLYSARPGQAEIGLTTGKNAKIVTTSRGDYVVFQNAGQLWVITPDQPQPTPLGTGIYPQLSVLFDNRVLCLWEQNDTVQAALIR